jgi:dienelactone hydrolase
MRRPGALLTALLIVLVGPLFAQPSVDTAFTGFWDAPDPTEAERRTGAIVASGVSFDEAIARLKRGRTYRADVPTGIVRRTHTIGGREFVYTLDVPATYDPSRRYQVRVHLHGGVMRPEGTPRGTGGIGALAGAEQIYVIPNSWADAQWWTDAQIENLRAILDAVKRTYNVDENHVAMSGVSDGGTGAYYYAMRDTTAYSSFLPLNGFIAVLANSSLDLSEGLFPNNLKNKPFFVVNGGLDPLYPAARVEPFVKHFEAGGVDTTYLPQPDGAHNTAWWPEVKDRFEAFVRDHPRRPLPDTLTWEADEVRIARRAHWMVLDRLNPADSGAELPDLNDRVTGTEPNFGVRAAGMRVTAVVKGSNAEGMGLRPGDVVVAVNGREIPVAVPLLDLLSIYDPNTMLTLKIAREGKAIELSGSFEPQMMPRVSPLFSRPRPSGRVDLVRAGNTVRAVSHGVGAFTLLLSPDVFDFSQPVTVIVNGRTLFSGRVEKRLRTLLEWAARDNDRTMLFAAELPVTIP